MNKKLFFAIFIFLGLTLGVISQWPDGKFHLVMCDVGQGDAILLSHNFSQILIDGGPNNRVTQCLAKQMPFWDRQVELVIATHPDKDHITGLINVIERYQVTSFVSINKANNTTVFEQLRAAVQQKQIPVHLAQKGEQLLVGDINLKVLSPEKNKENVLIWSASTETLADKQTLEVTANDSRESSNDESVVLRASFGQFDVLLTGDITSQIEKQLVDNFNLTGIEVLKVSHHGSKYSTSKDLLDELGAQVAIIGVGKNQWGHPDIEVLQRLQDFKVLTLRTDIDGEIKISSDGQAWWLEK